MKITTDSLTDLEISRLRKSVRASQLRLGAFVACFFGLAGTGITGVLFSVVGNPLAPFALMAAGFAISFVCVFGWWYSDREQRHKLDHDLSTGVYQELIVCSDRVVEMVPNGSWRCLAIACNNATLVVSGSWWDADNSDIQWTGYSKDQFPSTCFKLRVLPLSGKVVSVDVAGEKIDIEFESSSALPFTEIKDLRTDDIQIFRKPINELFNWPQEK